VKIRSVRHKGLRRLLTQDDPSGLPQSFVSKVRAILSFLQDASGLDALRSVPTWKVHPLTGPRKGEWSLSVTRNWRITFWIDDEGSITDLDFEDYH
jgi:plasmid maintenance system killer protein